MYLEFSSWKILDDPGIVIHQIQMGSAVPISSEDFILYLILSNPLAALLEMAASNFSASGAAEFPCFDSHVLVLITLMGLPPSYKVTQCNILLKAGSGNLILDSIKADLLNEERLLARESKMSDRTANALQTQRSNKKANRRGKPRTPEEKA